MKKIYSLFMVSVVALTVNAQLVVNENFTGYTNSDLGTQGSWVTTAGTPDVQVADASPLIYPGYTSGTQYVTVSATDGKDPHKLFSTSINTTSDVTLFMSFVVRVTSAAATSSQSTYSVALSNSADPDLPLRFYISSEPGNASKVRFGILTGNSTNANNIAWTAANGAYNTGTTYLIVIRYDISNAPGNNDDAYLWVNPGLSTEPNGSSNASVLNANEANFGNTLNALTIFQNSASSPVAAFDGFRVAHGTSSALAWSNLSPVGAPLPVQLTSFNASEESFGAKLVWNTMEESGITNYIIEKSTDGRSFTAIGTVKAANLRSYSFTDAQPAENSYYRLKMVELDGTFKYSFIISLKAKLTANISVSPNPVKNFVMIQHPKAGAAAHIQIINATGQTIRDIRLSANAVISNVDMSGLTNGLYHVVFKNGSAMFSKTVLKQ